MGRPYSDSNKRQETSEIEFINALLLDQPRAPTPLAILMAVILAVPRSWALCKPLNSKTLFIQVQQAYYDLHAYKDRNGKNYVNMKLSRTRMAGLAQWSCKAVA
jgi:hypothetical protein